MLALALNPSHSYLLAISGGGDSMALAYLAHTQGYKVAWAHVHHGWNTADDEACALVSQQAQALGVKLHIQRLKGGKPAHNAEAHARTARYAFFKECCETHGYAGVVLAHTQTDLAETFLMRAGKGSGVSGLAAMPAVTAREGLALYRPLLSTTREQLRAYLVQQGLAWHEDPENLTGGNQRAKLRAVLPALAEAGVPVHGLAAAAHALARAEAALISHESTVLQGADIADMPLAPLLQQSPELTLRHMAKVMKTYFPHQLPPRTSKRLAFLERLKQQPEGQATLGGLIWRWRKGWLRVWPESPKS